MPLFKDTFTVYMPKCPRNTHMQKHTNNSHMYVCKHMYTESLLFLFYVLICQKKKSKANECYYAGGC